MRMSQNNKIEITILSIFPEMFNIITNYGIIKKAIESGIVKINVLNLRDFTVDKHKVTDRPGYGGNNGMVMLVEPFFRFYDEYIKKK